MKKTMIIMSLIAFAMSVTSCGNSGSNVPEKGSADSQTLETTSSSSVLKDTVIQIIPTAFAVSEMITEKYEGEASREDGKSIIVRYCIYVKVDDAAFEAPVYGMDLENSNQATLAKTRYAILQKTDAQDLLATFSIDHNGAMKLVSLDKKAKWQETESGPSKIDPAVRLWK